MGQAAVLTVNNDPTLSLMRRFQPQFQQRYAPLTLLVDRARSLTVLSPLRSARVRDDRAAGNPVVDRVGGAVAAPILGSRALRLVTGATAVVVMLLALAPVAAQGQVDRNRL